MSPLPEEVFLSPEAEAERLWVGAQEAFGQAQHSIVELSEAVDLGVRVVEIMTVQCVQAVRDEFPRSIISLLESPPPEVEPERDFLHAPTSLRFADAVDLLSEPDLPCVSPQLHRGWEDRASSCRISRGRTFRAAGISLDATDRDALTLIGAYRNRIFFLPPPVRIVPDEVMGAYPTLIELVERLMDAARSSQA